MKPFQGVYIGSGCFLRSDTGCLAFVNRANRPVDLVIGKIYQLIAKPVPYGAIFYVVQGKES